MGAALALGERGRGRTAPNPNVGCIIVRDGRIVGRGQSTTKAATRLAMGVPWQEAGTPPPTAGNGSAMRAAPVGL